jgi:hypothetical protein
MALGLKYGRSGIEDASRVETVLVAGWTFMDWFRIAFGSTQCFELTKVNFPDPEQLNRFVQSPEHEKCVVLVRDTAAYLSKFIGEE